MPRHRPVHDDGRSSRIRNERQQYATDDWEAPCRIYDAKPGMYKKTDSRDMATDNAGVPLSDTLRRTGCCVPPRAIPR